VTSQTAKPQRLAPRPADYPFRVSEVVRFGDLDSQGHVNQAVYSTYFESGRVAMFRDKDLGIGVADIGFVVARIEIDYLHELHWPNDIEVGTGVAEIGRSSFTMAQAIFRGETCIAFARVTLVCIDLMTRKPVPLAPESVARLSHWKTGT
jgi:acyl-CoA thioester hydrolase